MVSKGCKFVRFMDSDVYRRYLGQITRNLPQDIIIEIERNRDKGVVGLWSKSPEIVEETIEKTLELEPKKVRIRGVEPVVDVFDEEDHLLIITELPGVERKDIKVNVDDDTLTISTDVPDCRCTEVELPCVVESKIKTTYKNGVLKIRLMKRRKK